LLPFAATKEKHLADPELLTRHITDILHAIFRIDEDERRRADASTALKVD